VIFGPFTNERTSSDPHSLHSTRAAQETARQRSTDPLRSAARIPKRAVRPARSQPGASQERSIAGRRRRASDGFAFFSLEAKETSGIIRKIWQTIPWILMISIFFKTVVKF